MARITDITDDLGGFTGLSLATTGCTSEKLDEKREIANSAIAEVFYQEAKEILCQNHSFLEAIAHALAERSVLMAEDIARIRESLQVLKAAA